MSRGLGRGGVAGRVTPQEGPGVTSYTPTITWTGGVISAIVAQTVHLPGYLIISGTFTNTGAANGTLSISLPSGFVANSIGIGTAALSPLTVAVGASVATLAAAAGSGSYSFQCLVPVSS